MRSSNAFTLILSRRLTLSRLQPPPPNAQITLWLDNLQTDGSWPDVDYKFSESPLLPAILHLERLAQIAGAWAHPASDFCGCSCGPEAISRGLSYWRQCNPLSANWWNNDIGVPLQLAAILTLMKESLAPELLEWGARRMGSGYRNGAYAMAFNPVQPDGCGSGPDVAVTGQNAIWLANLTLVAGCLHEDEAQVIGSMKTLEAQLRVAPFGEEGIQSDVSFHQHGSMLYTGGYGSSFANDLARIAWVTHGTPWQFAPEKLELLADFVLVGLAWSIWGDRFDFGVLGRNNTRLPTSARHLADSCDLLTQILPARAAEFQLFAASLRAEMPSPGVARGNRHFFRSDWMVHRRDGFHASVRMVSDRVLATESGNGEGLFNYHVADGAFQWLRHGDEYQTIAPLWNWRQIPGVTAAQSPAPLPRFEWGIGANGLTPWAGGVSDGENGCAAFLSLRDGVTAYKSWFFSGETALCLGAGISSQSPFPILTSIEQNASHGPVFIQWRDGTSEWLEDGERTEKSPLWAWHDGTAMVFLENARMSFSREKRCGNWQTINHTLPSLPIEATVFSALWHHGTKPHNQSYAYAIFPSQKPPIAAPTLPEIVSNTQRIQAVSFQNRWQIVFHQAATLQLGDGWTLEAAQPALVMLERSESGGQLCAAHPMPEQKELRFRLQALSGPRELMLCCNSTPETAGETVKIVWN